MSAAPLLLCGKLSRSPTINTPVSVKYLHLFYFNTHLEIIHNQADNTQLGGILPLSALPPMFSAFLII